jgi:hypothetical protein
MKEICHQNFNNKPEQNTMEKGTIEFIEIKDQGVEVVVNKVKGNVWMTQKQIAKLFDRSRIIITEHIKHILKDGELDKDKVSKRFQIEAQDGNKYDTTFYDLDMIIAVGFRVKSPLGIIFRRWARQQLKDNANSKKEQIAGIVDPKAEM